MSRYLVIELKLKMKYQDFKSCTKTKTKMLANYFN